MEKLVRDKIPVIVSKSKDRDKYAFEVMPDAEYEESLDLKLQEELKEYLDSGDIVELADLCEVVKAILNVRGISEKEFNQVMKDKRKSKGGFELKVKMIEL